MKDIFEKDDPFKKHLEKGFSVNAELCLIENLKVTMSEILKSGDEEKSKDLMPALASFMFGIQGQSAITFDNSADIQENPVIANLLLKIDSAIKSEHGNGANETDDYALYSSKFFSKETVSCIQEFLPVL